MLLDEEYDDVKQNFNLTLNFRYIEVSQANLPKKDYPEGVLGNFSPSALIRLSDILMPYFFH